MWFICGFGAPVLAAQVVVPLAYFGDKAVLRNDSTALGWTLIIFSAAIAFATMFCTVILLTIAVRILKRGRLLIHFFSERIVLERTKGRVVAAVYERITGRPARLRKLRPRRRSAVG